MDYLLMISILLEAIIVIVSVMAFLSKRKRYAIGLALTFAIYVFYDSIRLLNIGIDPIIQEGSFLIATLAALWAVWNIYKNK
jgi:hypothetical protein